MPKGIIDQQSLNKKSWRAITYDWNDFIQYTGRECVVCLTDFQIAWLLSNAQYMGWLTRWSNCPCTPEELQAMQAELEYQLMSCLDLFPYKIDYNYQQAVNAQLQTFNDAWDGVNPSSVNPNTPDDFYSGDGSDDRVDALCTACYVYIYSYSQNWVSIAQTTLGIVAVVGLAASISIVGGIIASVLVGGLFLITQTALDAMQDTDALDNVVCCMRDALDGQAITFANFEAALDSCGFTVGSNEAIIRDIIASDLDKFDNWLSFINNLGDSFVLAENNISICPCGDPVTITVTFDAVSTIDFNLSVGITSGTTQVIAPVIQSNQNGNPIPSAKTAFVTSGGGSFEGLSLRVRVELTDILDVTSVDFDMWYRRWTSGNVLSHTIRLLDSSLVQIAGANGVPTAIPQQVWTQSNIPISGNGVKYVECQIVVVDTAGPPTPSNQFGFIDNIVISGTVV